jgi:hypothetical protein
MSKLPADTRKRTGLVIVANHEASHAVAAHRLNLKLTRVPIIPSRIASGRLEIVNRLARELEPRKIQCLALAMLKVISNILTMIFISFAQCTMGFAPSSGP